LEICFSAFPKLKAGGDIGVGRPKQNSDAIPGILIEDGRILFSTEKTAYFFDVTDRTIRNWEKSGAPGKARHGWWDIKELRKWVEADDESSLNTRKIIADVKYRELKAQREEISIQELEGFYMKKEDVASEWAKRVLEVKKALLALCRKIAVKIPDPDMKIYVEGLVETEVYDLLDQFARHGKYTPKSDKQTKSKQQN
jgi:hypothetical protein